jgi:sugar lactone lactonase YvrE
MRRLEAELVLDAGAEVAEGPLWDPRCSQLCWVDVTAGMLHRFDPSSGHDQPVRIEAHVGAVALRRRGGYVLAVRDGFAAISADLKRVDPIAAVLADDPTVRMNDGKADAAGRFWAGSMAYDLTPGRGTLFCLDPAAGPTAALPGVTLSNGLGWSPDNTILYYIDTPTRGIDAIDFDPGTGHLGARTRWVDIPATDGLPDGLTVDADGAVWVALSGAGRIRRYTPTGDPDTEVIVPASQVTSCGFGGPDMRDLYITTAAHGLDASQRQHQPHAGALFCAGPATSGLPTASYRG